MPNALIVYGGYQGHQPNEMNELFSAELKALGYTVESRDTLEAYADEDLMSAQDLIVPCWTMGEIANDQWKVLSKTVKAGCGFAGFHGGIIDAMRKHTGWQFMTGGQFVDHPGGCDIPGYTVNITDSDHEITKGIGDFALPKTEQYYCHVDPAVQVLATTTFEDHDEIGDGPNSPRGCYPVGTVMPYAWTRMWKQGRVFVAAWGHNTTDFDVPEAKQLVLNGLEWATRKG